jgi:hypothetical protein
MHVKPTFSFGFSWYLSAAISAVEASIRIIEVSRNPR